MDIWSLHVVVWWFREGHQLLSALVWQYLTYKALYFYLVQWLLDAIMLRSNPGNANCFMLQSH